MLQLRGGVGHPLWLEFSSFASINSLGVVEGFNVPECISPDISHILEVAMVHSLLLQGLEESIHYHIVGMN